MSYIHEELRRFMSYIHEELRRFMNVLVQHPPSPSPV